MSKSSIGNRPACASSAGRQGDVAVIGVACRFPGADDPEAFWELLRAGGSGIGPEPPGREATAGPSGVGGYLSAVDGFDAEFFGLAPREAAAMDPQQRLMLELAWEALEQAGTVPGTLRGDAVGVFVGAIADDYATLARRGTAAQPHTFTGQERGVIANRISYTLGLTGPSMVVDTAQSSALVAVHLACESVRRQESSLALAGGVNLILAPEGAAALTEFGALSPDGRCFTFDERANGYVRGEGGGLVLLKRLDEALADGDRVLCVIRGGAVNSDGATATLPTPGAEGQERVLRAACRQAATEPAEIQYVELHGSATKAGDRVEAAALGAVLADSAPGGVPLAVGSVKTNIGHLEGAAGIAGLIKTVLCLTHRTLVPSLHHDTPDPDLELDRLGLRVQRETAPWPGGEQGLVAGVSSFGVGGTNCHLVLSDLTGVRVGDRPDTRADSSAESFLQLGPGDPLPFPVSARSEAALRQQAARLGDWLNRRPDIPPTTVGRTLAHRRTFFEHRAVALAADPAGLTAELGLIAAARPSAVTAADRADTPAAPVFVFPGQGSQWPGMAVRLLDSSPVFARSFGECAAALREFVDWDPHDVVRDAPGAPPLDRVDVVQPVLWSVMVSLAEVWRAAGVEPAAVVGHSQGEVAAATVAGALSLTDAARIVVRRSAALLRITGQGAMGSVLLPPEQVRRDLTSWDGALGVLAVNGPGQTIVGGDPEAFARLTEQYAEAGVELRAIRADVVSHCAQVEVFRDELLAALAPVRPRKPAVPFWSTVTGGLLDPAVLDADYWYRNLRQEVRFGETVRQLLHAGHSTFVEISPHPVLATGLTQNADALNVPAVVLGSLRRDRDDVHSILASLGEAWTHGLPVRWDRIIQSGSDDWADVPTYAFHRRGHWLDGVPAAPEHPSRTPVAAPEAEHVGDTGPVARLAGQPRAVAAPTVLALVRDQVAAVMGHEDGRAVRPRSTFKDLGFDSSMIVALRNRLASATGLAVPVDSLYGHPTPSALADHLLDRLHPADADEHTGLRERIDELAELVADAGPEPPDGPALAQRLDELAARLRGPARPTDDRGEPDLAASVATASVDELLALIDNSLQ
jgi:acyl transferase domain-containing protein